MIKCKTCNYYFDDGKIEWCAYYNEEISTIIIRSMCSWLEKEENDNNKN